MPGVKRRRKTARSAVVIEHVGAALVEDLRRVYHHACQFQDSDEFVAASLAVYALLQEVQEQLIADMEDELPEDFDVERVIQFIPQRVLDAAAGFMAANVFHTADTAQPHASPGFSFRQVGEGMA